MSATGRAFSIEESAMRHRLCYILPDVASTEQTIRELLNAGIEIPQIHCVARPGLPLGELPEASFLQKADVMNKAGTGLVFGATLGAIVGGLLVLFPPVGADLQMGTMPITALVGAVFGAWASCLRGHALSDSATAAFEEGAAQGNILLMVDAPFTRSREISDLVQLRHPAALFDGNQPGMLASS